MQFNPKYLKIRYVVNVELVAQDYIQHLVDLFAVQMYCKCIEIEYK